MEAFFRTHQYLVEHTNAPVRRGLMDEIDWNDRLIGFNHLCLEVDDTFAAVKNVRDSGYPIDIEPKQGSDFNWQAWITDPNGIRIELMQIMPDSPQAGYVFRG